MADTTANIIIKAEIANARAGLAQLKQAVADGNKTVSQAANEMRAYEKTIKDANKVAGQGSSAFGGLFKQFTAGALAAQGVGMAIGAVTDFVKDSFKAALEEEKQWNRMGGAINAVGGSVKDQLPQFQAMTDQLEMMSGVADKDISASFAKMTRAMIPMNKQYAMLKTALNISIDKEMDLGSGTELLIKAIAGKDMALEKLAATYGITTTKADNYYTVIDKIAKLSSGALQSAMEGNVGEVERAGIVYDRFLEDIGKGFTTAVGQTIIAIRQQNIATELLKSFNAGELNKEFDKFGDNAEARLDAITADFKTVAEVSAEWGSNGAIFDPLLMDLVRLQKATQKQVELTELPAKAMVYANESRQLNTLADRYDTLTSKTSLTVKEKAELKKVITDINTLMPTAISNWGSEIDVITANTSSIRTNVAARNATQKLTLKELFKGVPEIGDQLDAARAKVDSLKTTVSDSVLTIINDWQKGATALNTPVTGQVKELADALQDVQKKTADANAAFELTNATFSNLEDVTQYGEAVSLAGVRMANTALAAQQLTKANEDFAAIPVVQELHLMEMPLVDQYAGPAKALKDFQDEMNAERLASYNETNTSIAEADKFLRDLEISYMEEGRAKELAIQQASYNDTIRHYLDLVDAGKLGVDQFIAIKESLDKGIGKEGKKATNDLTQGFRNAAMAARELFDILNGGKVTLGGILQMIGSFMSIFPGTSKAGGIFGIIGSILPFDDPVNDSMLRREVARITRFSLEGAERGRREYGNQNASVSNSNSVNMGDTIIQVIGAKDGEDVVAQIDKYMTTIYPQRVKDGTIKGSTTESYRGR